MRAVEDALGVKIPNNARILRNILEGIQYVQDHVIHFYHLHALDWVDVVSALDADPAGTSELAQSISDWSKSSTDYFQGVKDRLAAYINSGQLGPFGNAYWGHPAYKLPPEANLMAVAHYLEALDWQRDVIRAHALLGSKNPHLQTYLAGGMATPIDPTSQAAINADTIAMLKELFNRAKEFVDKVYLPDVLAVAPFYLDWAGIGGGDGNFLSYGDFPEADGSQWLPSGYIIGKDLSKVYPVDQNEITEYVTHSWYEYDDETKGLHPYDGETRPNYTGPEPPYNFLNVDNKYSWMKAPRIGKNPMEVGPLARMLVAYASGHKRVVETVDSVLGALSKAAGTTIGPEALFSTLGRTPPVVSKPSLLLKSSMGGSTNWRPALPAVIMKSTPTKCGTRLTGPPKPKAGASPKRHAARSATGSRLKTKRSRPTRSLSPAPGTVRRATG